MRELVIGPKTVVIVSAPYSTPQAIDKTRHFVIGSLEKAGIAIEHERIIAVERGVSFTAIEPVAEGYEEFHDGDFLVGTADQTKDRGYPVTWDYVRGCERKMQELQAEIDRWKMVAEGGHALPTTDQLLDDVANLMEDGLAAKLSDVRIKFEAAAKRCRERAALLRSHLEAPRQG